MCELPALGGVCNNVAIPGNGMNIDTGTYNIYIAQQNIGNKAEIRSVSRESPSWTW